MSPLSTSASHSVEHVRGGDFEQKVLRSEMPVVVDFHAVWCRPCRALGPVLEQFVRENPGVKLVKVDVDENAKLAAHYRINAVPCVMVFRDGRMTSRRTGLLNSVELKRMLAE